MGLLSNDQFLTQLNNQFEKTKENGTVYVSMKRYKWDHKELRKKNADPSLVSEDEKFQCLFRAVQNKHKISTLVTEANAEKFIDAYSNLLALHLDSLKKKKKGGIKKKTNKTK
ncbi:signal recognition particle 14 kDa protein [Neocallimastix lanati (nom. inval.)]|uniref:Signal recognition particle subunit SRP14 n=1 Tax=Neocallimastix californiae TaxID=1754190 RepID=A0A1Y2DI73_9FUNG|nr:signal recognition particle 14 kDa protein [Neocallimastix sp. JGI-2020a]ORY58932.1 signal recognition particle 14 kDa protein [Neocallimastix californiae]|eukprot:ORY58932.1 signal recognition particle 14 kDa protein [Neocallimastix californiae]